MNICPACKKKHNKFPRQCYYTIYDDYTHVVIAKQATGAPSCITLNAEYIQRSEDNWKNMREYVKQFNLPEDINL